MSRREYKTPRARRDALAPKIAELAALGTYAQDIAAELGIKVAHTRRIARENDITIQHSPAYHRPPRISPRLAQPELRAFSSDADRREFCLTSVEAGFTMRAVGSALGVTKQRVEQMCCRARRQRT